MKDIRIYTHRMIRETLMLPDVNKIMHTISSYDLYTEFHCISVGIESVTLGIFLGLSENELKELAKTGLLHDCGKVLTPITTIQKKGKLSEQEFYIIKQHPQLGAQILESNGNFSDRIINGVLEHHENFDGSGYPNGLEGEDISLFGRIIRITDSYDAIIDKRPYHHQREEKVAVEHIAESAGTLYDPDITKMFMDMADKGKAEHWRTIYSTRDYSEKIIMKLKEEKRQQIYA